MHSRIMGIVEKNYYDEHKDEHDWKLSWFYADEVPHFADYCSEDTDVDEDFMWLIECLVQRTDSSLIDIDDKELTIKFKPGFKEAYFRKKWETLVKNVIGAPDAFEQFCGIKQTDFAYRCRKLLNEEYSFYVSDEEGCYETLDEWIRKINYDKTYKCFDTVDYHF